MGAAFPRAPRVHHAGSSGDQGEQRSQRAEHDTDRAMTLLQNVGTGRSHA